MPELSQITDLQRIENISSTIQTPLYKEKVLGNLNEKHEVALLSITDQATNTYNDSYTQNINGHTEARYNSRTVTCHGAYTQTAQGNKLTTCMKGNIQIYLGLKSTQKIGPAFFTLSLANTLLSLGMKITTTPLNLKVGVLQSTRYYGALLDIAGCDTVIAHSASGTPVKSIEQTVLSSSNISSELDVSGTWDYRRLKRSETSESLRSLPPPFPPPPPPPMFAAPGLLDSPLLMSNYHDYEVLNDLYESTDKYQHTYMALEKQDYEHIYATISSIKKESSGNTPTDEQENPYETPVDASL